MHASPPDTQKLRWLQSSIPPTATWLSLNYGEHNLLHVRRHTLPSQPSQLLITPFFLLTHNPTHHEFCSKNTNFIFHAANKNLFLKTFWLSASYFFILSFHFLQPSEGNNKLSEEKTQCKHTYVTPSSSLNTNNFSSLKTKLSLVNNNNFTSSYRFIYLLSSIL